MNLTQICRTRHRFIFSLTCLFLASCSPAATSTSVTPAELTETPQATTQSTPPDATPMRMTDDAFRFAAYEGKLDEVREGLTAGNNVNALDPEKRLTPLHMAAYNGNTEVVKLLLEHGATLDARDIEGKTPLLHACTGPFVETVKLLIDKGADVNAIEATEAFSPLMMAAGLGQIDIVKVLLAHNANKELRDNDGDTALTHAETSKHAEIAQLLRE